MPEGIPQPACPLSVTAGLYVDQRLESESSTHGDDQAARGQAESQPISRVLSRAAIPLGPTSPSASSGLPGSTRGRALRPLAEPRLPYLALLQVGFAVPSDVAIDAVRSYRTVSPLPAPFPALRRSTLCCTVRELALPRRYLAPCPLSPDFPPRRLSVTQRLPG
jgi:hypothetical protein